MNQVVRITLSVVLLPLIGLVGTVGLRRSW